MNYDDKFETVDDLLNAIDEAMQSSMENDIATNCDDYIRYRFDDEILEFDDAALITDSSWEELQKPDLLPPVTVH